MITFNRKTFSPLQLEQFCVYARFAHIQPHERKIHVLHSDGYTPAVNPKISTHATVIFWQSGQDYGRPIYTSLVISFQRRFLQIFVTGILKFFWFKKKILNVKFPLVTLKRFLTVDSWPAEKNWQSTGPHEDLQSRSVQDLKTSEPLFLETKMKSKNKSCLTAPHTKLKEKRFWTSHVRMKRKQ